MNNFTENSIQEKQKKRQPRKDRSAAKYQMEDFLALPREQQINLANEYLLRPVQDYDDGTLGFGRSTFMEYCKKNDIVLRYVDAREETQRRKEICISHGKRKATVEKKYTLSMETVAMIDELFAGLSNIEKSKAMDELLRPYLQGVLSIKKEGGFAVYYKAAAAEKLI